MPPKKDNSYDPLHDLAALPGEDNRFYNDMYNDSGDQQAPQQVISDVSQTPAAPEIPQTGMRFDFGSLNVQTKEDFNALPEEQKELLRAMKRGVQFTPESAAKFVLGQRERQQRLAESKNSSQEQLAEKRIAALDNETTQGAEQLRRRASNMIWLLDNLRGGRPEKVKDGSEKWRTRVGSVDGRWPSLLSSEETLGWNADFNSLKGMINLNEAQGNRGQGQFSDSERKLMAEAASLGLEQARDEKGFKSAFERMYDLAKDAEKSALDKLSKNGPKQSLQATSSSVPSFTVGQRLTDKFGNVRIYRGTDQSGRPILDPVQ